MKELFRCTVAIIIAVGLMGFTGSLLPGHGECLAADGGPVLTMGTPLVKMSKKSQVVIMGSGFKPGQEVRILITTPDGLQSDIGYALTPEPKADNAGAWATTWDAGRYVSRKLIDPKGGAYKILAADADYNPIAHAPVFFEPAAPAKKKKK